MIQIGDTVVIKFNHGDIGFYEAPISYIGRGFVQIDCANYKTSINLLDGKFPAMGTRLDELMQFVEYRPMKSKNWKKGVRGFVKDRSKRIW